MKLIAFAVLLTIAYFLYRFIKEESTPDPRLRNFDDIDAEYWGCFHR